MKNRFLWMLPWLLLLFELPAHAVSFVEEYAYDAGEADSKLTCRSISLLQVKRLLVERLGTHLESNTVVTNSQISKDEIVSFSAGVVKTEILDEYWDGRTYRLKAQIEADPQAVVQMIETLKKSGKRAEEIEETNEKYLAKINDLKQELTKTQSDFVQVTRDYMQSSKIISAWDAFETGIQLYREGKADESIAAFSKAIEANPKAIYYFHRGRSYRQIQHYQEALTDLTTAIEMDSTFAGAYFQRGMTFNKLGKKKKGQADIQKAAELGSGDARRWLKLKGK
jgi:tetratricopeptide (TPR) repeat protein